jgi:hypothetical protein
MRYPNIIYFRYDKYKHYDTFFTLNKDALWCNVNVHSAQSNACLNLLFDPNYHLLVTLGDNEKNTSKTSMRSCHLGTIPVGCISNSSPTWIFSMAWSIIVMPK